MAQGQGKTDQQGSYIPIGAVTRAEVSAQSTPASATGARSWRFAEAEGGARAEVALLADGIARVRLIPSGVTPAHSWAVIHNDADWPAFTINEAPLMVGDAVGESEAAGLALTTAAMRVEIATDPLRVTFRWPDGAPFAEDDPALGMGVVAALGTADIPDGRRPGGSVRSHKRLAPGERIVGAGMRTSPLDARGQRVTFWNIDPRQPHGDATGPMYVSVPFWLGLRNGRAYGVFLDSVWRSDLDAGASNPHQLSFGAAGGELTYYVFAGPTPAAVLAQYSALTGRMPLPPRWALGYGQSRWSYSPEAHLRAVADEFRRRRIPCDHLWLDIDYMDGYRDFTWNPDRYPDPQRLLGDLHDQGYKVVAIVDPGVKADPTDPTFAEGVARDYFVRRPDGSLFIGVVWPGESVFADFSRADVRAWWGARQRALLDAGISGIWDDMNEPAFTNRLVPTADVPPGSTMPPDILHHPEASSDTVPHAAFHNAYGMQMARATYEGQLRACPDRRPFTLTRSGYAGVQRYAAVWTGDNQSRWEHLRLAARMCLSLGLSGLPFAGFDTGGFWRDANGELLVRFTQLGSVFPFFRNHSALETPSQEPWAFGQPFEALCRAAIELRYRLLPYIYTTTAEAARFGAPITRPMLYAFPHDDALAPLEDQFLLGPDLLIAPALHEGELQRLVSFPQATDGQPHLAWRDWRTGQRHVGPTRVMTPAPLDTLPIFIREGAIIPLGPVMQYVGELTEEPLTLVCALGPVVDGVAIGASGDLYEDDGATTAYQQGAWRRTHFVAHHDGSRVIFRAQPSSGDYTPAPRPHTIELRLPYDGVMDGPRPRITSARLNGRDLPAEAFAVSIARRYETRMSVALGRVDAPYTLDVTLG